MNKYRITITRNIGTLEAPKLSTETFPLEVSNGESNVATAHNAACKIYDSDPTIFAVWFDGVGNSGFTGFGPRWSAVSPNLRS